MSLDDFSRLTFDEIDEILKRWAETHRERVHSDWEIMRMHTFLTLKPFCTKMPDPRRFLPFPWEEKPEEPEEEAPLSEEESRAVLEEQKRMTGW